MADLFAPRTTAVDAITLAQRLLFTVFGLSALRPGQDRAVAAVCARRDAVVLMPTGGGKSLCYQLPAVTFRRMGKGPTVVISPLIALMNDQVASLMALGIRAVALHSQQDVHSAEQVWHDLRRNTYDVLFMAPERAVLPGTAKLLQTLRPALLAIDEAHLQVLSC